MPPPFVPSPLQCSPLTFLWFLLFRFRGWGCWFSWGTFRTFCRCWSHFCSIFLGDGSRFIAGGWGLLWGLLRGWGLFRSWGWGWGCFFLRGCFFFWGCFFLWPCFFFFWGCFFFFRGWPCLFLGRCRSRFFGCRCSFACHRCKASGLGKGMFWGLCSELSALFWGSCSRQKICPLGLGSGFRGWGPGSGPGVPTLGWFSLLGDSCAVLGGGTGSLSQNRGRVTFIALGWHLSPPCKPICLCRRGCQE